MKTYKLYDKDDDNYIKDDCGVELIYLTLQEADYDRWYMLEEEGFPLFTFPAPIEVHEFEDGIYKGVPIYMLLN